MCVWCLSCLFKRVWLCLAGKLLWKVLILLHRHGALILPSAPMTHETLTSCFIHILIPPLPPVLHASPSMFNCLVTSPLCPSSLLCAFWLSLNRVFSVPVCLSVCLCPCDVCSGLLSDTPPAESGEEFNLWPFLLGFCRSPSGGPLMGWSFFYLSFSLFSLCGDGGPTSSSRRHSATVTYSGFYF